MVRTSAARMRVTISSACLSTALAFMAIVPAGAADASAAPESPGASGPPVASPAAAELPGAEAIANGHGRYVAVGTDEASPKEPVAWVSTDGMTWDAATIADAGPGSHMVAVTPTSDGFVALGYARDLDGAESNRILAWHSADGTGWEQATVQRPASREFDAFPAALADGPAGLLALGSFVGQDLAGQRLWHSPDGQSWEPVALPDVKGDAIWDTVVGVPGGYALLGQRGQGRGGAYVVKPSNWHSVDGVTWEKLGGLPSSTLAASPDGTVVAIGGTHVWRSSDLVEWEQVWSVPAEWASRSGDTAFEKRYGARDMFGWVEWAGDRFLLTGRDYGACPGGAVGYLDGCMRYPLLQSADGRTWTQVNGPDGSVGLSTDTWLEDVASDGISTVLLDASGDGPTVAWRSVNEPLATTVAE